MRAGPLRRVPWAVWLLLAGALAAQSLVPEPAHHTQARTLHPPPPMLHVAALGEPVALARLAMLYVHAAEGRTALRRLDYPALRAWLEAILALDPRGPAPLLAASQLYAGVQDPARARLMLDFVYQEFLRDPDRRWPHLAHAALAARHRLRDLPLARRYAQAIRTRASAGVLPPWALQMEAFILEDMGEAAAARALIGAMLANGQVRDPNELRFLERRLQLLEGPGEPATGAQR